MLQRRDWKAVQSMKAKLPGERKQARLFIMFSEPSSPCFPGANCGKNTRLVTRMKALLAEDSEPALWPADGVLQLQPVFTRSSAAPMLAVSEACCWLLRTAVHTSCIYKS